jgi:hypothetical protein
MVVLKTKLLHDILIKFSIPKSKLNQDMFQRNSVQSKNRKSSRFPFKNGLRHRDALSPLLFNFAIEYGIRKVHETNLGLERFMWMTLI